MTLKLKIIKKREMRLTNNNKDNSGKLIISQKEIVLIYFLCFLMNFYGDQHNLCDTFGPGNEFKFFGMPKTIKRFPYVCLFVKINGSLISGRIRLYWEMREI